MSGIEDQGLRPEKVEAAPTDESETPSDLEQHDAEEPSTEDLREPSTEKEPGEEPKAQDASQPEEPSHEAVGIGIIGRPQTEMEDETD
ncbi:hypothetical protein [Microbacterium sp. TWP3-1-2b2]|uniref:hypothetical protein n=1 Tax=Microbacterium sp. TWP3-1-2b2 TaxID=2804651 RepID=UPI003CE7F90C